MSVSSLDELIGLETAKSVVRGLWRSDCAVHAVLFYGGEGSGKTALARLLAKAWLCTGGSDDGPCGECRTCASFERDACLDYLPVAPYGLGNFIRLPQIHPVSPMPKDLPPREPVQTFLRTPPLTARRKVVLFEEADRMNGDAAAAMLKTLEEPPEYAKLILTSQAISRIHATIVSRSLAIACSQPTEEQLRGFVGDLGKDEAAFVGGAVGEALRLRGHPEVYAELIRFHGSLEERPVGEALVAADEFRGICEQIGQAEGCAARQAQAEALKLLARCKMKAEVQRPSWVHAIVETHRAIVGNANAGPALDAMFARMLLDR